LVAGRLAGKTAFITAAAQGIGRGAALAFAREGAKVWATDVNAKALAEIEGKNGIRTRCSTRPTRPPSPGGRRGRRDRRAVQLRGLRAPRHDPRVHAEGLGLQLQPEREVHVPGDARVPARHAEAGRGSIINMSSIASSVKGLPNRFVYGATKAAWWA
jgi:2-keto-3-deoxy-L-fuconate dehydrogenase